MAWQLTSFRKCSIVWNFAVSCLYNVDLTSALVKHLKLRNKASPTRQHLYVNWPWTSIIDIWNGKKAKHMGLGYIWMIITSLRQLNINHNRLLPILFDPSTYLEIISQAADCLFEAEESQICVRLGRPQIFLCLALSFVLSVTSIARWFLTYILLLDALLHKWYGSPKLYKFLTVNHEHFWA